MDIIYPGTFDPVTNGHFDVIERSSRLFKKVIVAVAASSGKQPMFSQTERVEMIRESIKPLSRVVVEAFSVLLIDYAKEKGIKNILRSLRVASDFEYELQLALMYRAQDRELETIFLMPNQKYIFLSSSMIREIARLGGDIKAFVPEYVYNQILKKIGHYHDNVRRDRR